MSSHLIIVTGMPASGKTTLARGISKELSLPLIEKDSIKEKLFDSLGWSDREWSKKVSFATYDLMYYFMEQLLANNQSLVVESNFKPEFANKEIQKLSELYNFKVTQIVCSADRKVLYDRFLRRARSGNRHPGHVDAQNAEEWRDYFFNQENKVEALGIDSVVINIDNTHFKPDTVMSVVAQIKKLK